jgi:dolichol kinase
MAKHGEITRASFAGISALGVGDSAAAFFGKRYGKLKIFRDEKESY